MDDIEPNFKAVTDPEGEIPRAPREQKRNRNERRVEKIPELQPQWNEADSQPVIPAQSIAPVPVVSQQTVQQQSNGMASDSQATTTTMGSSQVVSSNGNQTTTVASSNEATTTKIYLYVSNGTTLTATNVISQRGLNGTNDTIPVTFTVQNRTIVNAEITGVLFTGCSGDISAFPWSPLAFLYTLLLPFVLLAI